MSTANDIAQWIRDGIVKDEVLYQQQAVSGIINKFGDEFIYMNNNGNPAIPKVVPKEFRNLTEDTVIWKKSNRCWRLRDEHDTLVNVRVIIKQAFLQAAP